MRLRVRRENKWKNQTQFLDANRRTGPVMHPRLTDLTIIVKPGAVERNLCLNKLETSVSCLAKAKIGFSRASSLQGRDVVENHRKSGVM